MEHDVIPVLQEAKLRLNFLLEVTWPRRCQNRDSNPETLPDFKSSISTPETSTSCLGLKFFPSKRGRYE